jgi:hypothetical protein
MPCTTSVLSGNELRTNAWIRVPFHLRAIEARSRRTASIRAAGASTMTRASMTSARVAPRRCSTRPAYRAATSAEGSWTRAPPRAARARIRRGERTITLETKRTERQREQERARHGTLQQRWGLRDTRARSTARTKAARSSVPPAASHRLSLAPKLLRYFYRRRTYGATVAPGSSTRPNGCGDDVRSVDVPEQPFSRQPGAIAMASSVATRSI